jgi:hypothetical protein
MISYFFLAVMEEQQYKFMTILSEFRKSVFEIIVKILLKVFPLVNPLSFYT